MLSNTLILPESDARLAVRLLADAIDDLDVVLMLIFGRDERAERIVHWADQLANKTKIGDTHNLRHVIWVRRDDSVLLGEKLAEIVGPGDLPSVAVLDFHDKLRHRIEPDAPVDPLTLELAFLEGHRR